MRASSVRRRCGCWSSAGPCRSCRSCPSPSSQASATRTTASGSNLSRMRAVGSFNFKLKFWNFKKNQTEIDRLLPKYEFLLLAKCLKTFFFAQMHLKFAKNMNINKFPQKYNIGIKKTQNLMQISNSLK
jgi:hypothetical protein